MKVTIQVPDELYRKVKAKTAAQGRRVREVSIELFERWVNEGRRPETGPSAEQWLADWFAMADAAPPLRRRERRDAGLVGQRTHRAGQGTIAAHMARQARWVKVGLFVSKSKRREI